MDADKPRRPRWRKKRWWLALVAALILPLLLYPAAARHALYLVGRGDLPAGPVARLTLFRAWPITGDGPADWYQARIEVAYQVGLTEAQQTISLRWFEEEADDPTKDPVVRQRYRNEAKVIREELERLHSEEAPFLFRRLQYAR
jgi:hypothetical protein